MLVEGSAVRIETQNGMSIQYNYAETFVVPAAAISYTLINLGTTSAKVIAAFIKPNHYAQKKVSAPCRFTALIVPLWFCVSL